MGMCVSCFGNLPFPTEACQEVYPHPPQLFWQFMVIYCGMPENVWAFAQSVSGIYCSLLSHSRRCIHAHRNCFGNFSKSTEACWQRYGMHRKCFGNLLFPTKACWEVYPYPPKLFRQFMVTFHGKPAMVWACAENVLVISPDLQRWQRYGDAPKVF